MSIFTPFILCLLLSCACGSPAVTLPSNVPGRGTEMRMDRFQMRYQAGTERSVEIAGETAALFGSDRVNMETVALTFYRDNLEFLRLTARTAQARIAAKDSGSVTLSEDSGRLYYGGNFQSETLKLSFEDGTWRSDGSAAFQRPPLTLSARAAYGPLSLEEVYAKDAKIQAEGSTASGDIMLFRPTPRLIFLQGRAKYASDSVNLQAERLTLQIDPTYSRLTPVK